MKRDGSKIQKLRALVVELNVAVADMEQYNSAENDELPIILTIFMLFPAMIMTAQYMIDKYSHTTQQTKETK